MAAPRQGKLGYVAELTSGFTDEAKEQLAPLLSRHSRQDPVVPCPKRARWVEPELYCQVRFLEWTEGGRLRHAHFRGVISQ